MFAYLFETNLCDTGRGRSLFSGGEVGGRWLSSHPGPHKDVLVHLPIDNLVLINEEKTSF